MTSINGIGGGPRGLGHPGLDRRAPVDQEQPKPNVETNPSAHAAPAESGAAGVDPELWDMLTADERVFYLRNAMTGPLTYGPGVESSTSATPRSRLGGRIDVRG